MAGAPREQATSPVTGRDVLVLVVALVATVTAVNALASIWLRDQAPTPLTERPAHVLSVPRTLTNLPPSLGDRALLLLIGNSHTYGLPGLAQGQPLRPETTGTLVDELARRIDPVVGADSAAYYRLSYPNFLPFEILTSVGYEIYEGYRPSVVVMGWTWQNIARHRGLRYDVSTVYYDPRFVHYLRETLESQDGSEAADILAAIDVEVRKAQTAEEEQRMQSDADRADGELTEWLDKHLTLVGRSADLRGRLYKNVIDRLQDAMVDRIQNYQYGVIEADLDFNLKCMRAVLRLLKQNGVAALIYYAPQRSDLPSLADERQEEAVMGQLSKMARGLGFAVVDATPIVPNEYWGWADQYPDTAHFTEPGHRLLAEFLFRKGLEAHTWDALRDGHPGSAPTTEGRATVP